MVRSIRRVRASDPEVRTLPKVLREFLISLGGVLSSGSQARTLSSGPPPASGASGGPELRVGNYDPELRTPPASGASGGPELRVERYDLELRDPQSFRDERYDPELSSL